MRSSYGYGKFEVLTIITLALVLFAYLSYSMFGKSDAYKYRTMRESAISFSKSVSLNNSSFHNLENVYLEEAIEEQVLKSIKNPFGSGYCSESESFVHIDNGMPYVTLKCGDVLIDNKNFSGSRGDITYFKVTEWNEEQNNSDDEQRVLYNCTVDGEELFEKYYDELYFVYKVNSKYGTEHFYHDSVTECNVVSKTFFRSKVEVDGKGKAIK